MTRLREARASSVFHTTSSNWCGSSVVKKRPFSSSQQGTSFLEVHGGAHDEGIGNYNHRLRESGLAGGHAFPSLEATTSIDRYHTKRFTGPTFSNLIVGTGTKSALTVARQAATHRIQRQKPRQQQQQQQQYRPETAELLVASFSSPASSVDVAIAAMSSGSGSGTPAFLSLERSSLRSSNPHTLLMDRSKQASGRTHNS